VRGIPGDPSELGSLSPPFPQSCTRSPRRSRGCAPLCAPVGCPFRCGSHAGNFTFHAQ
jgi:hypothetical protein